MVSFWIGSMYNLFCFGYLSHMIIELYLWGFQSLTVVELMLLYQLRMISMLHPGVRLWEAVRQLAPKFQRLVASM